jgi:hypothetical protein
MYNSSLQAMPCGKRSYESKGPKITPPLVCTRQEPGWNVLVGLVHGLLQGRTHSTRPARRPQAGQRTLMRDREGEKEAHRVRPGYMQLGTLGSTSYINTLQP